MIALLVLAALALVIAVVAGILALLIAIVRSIARAAGRSPRNSRRAKSTEFVSTDDEFRRIIETAWSGDPVFNDDKPTSQEH